MKRIIVSLICIFIFASYISAIAEVKIFIKEYTYQASEIDSKVSSRTIALEQVKRLLLEELGTYLEGQTEVKNYQLTKEQITSITAGIVQTKIIDEKWNGKEYWLKAKITADPKKVAKDVDSLRKDRQRVRDLEESSKTTSKALKEAERIKKEISSAQKTDKAKIKQYNRVMDEIRAEEWFLKAGSLCNSGKPFESLAAINKAIELVNDSKIAGKYYFVRGGFYFLVFEDYEKAAQDFDKAIKLNQEIGMPCYGLRGMSYLQTADYEKAIQDLDKAIAMESNGNWLYHQQRGIAHSMLGNYRKTIFDYGVAIKLKPEESSLYSKRAQIFCIMDDYLSGIKDCDKAIQLDPENSDAYFNRAGAYSKLGIEDQSDKDLEIAASLGNEMAQHLLKLKEKIEQEY